MAPMKRPAAVALGGAKKKPATSGPVAKKCKVVADAVLDARCIPDTVRSMLGLNLPESLGVAKEERHPFQEKVVAMVGEVLSGIEASIKETMSACEAKVGEAETEKTTRTSAQEGVTATLNEKSEAADAAKVAHMDSIAAEKAAKAAQVEAAKELKAAAAELATATAKRAKLESALKDAYMPLKESGDMSMHATSMATLEEVGAEFGLNASLLTSLSSALAKAPDSRGSFDGVCLQQAEDELAKLITDASEKVVAAEAAKTTCDEKVAAATAAHEAATATVAAAVETLSSCQAAVKAAQVDLKAATKAVKEFGPQMKQVEADLQAAKVDLQTLHEGAMAAYTELMERSAIPPPPVEPEIAAAPEEPGTAEEAAPAAMEEAATA